MMKSVLLHRKKCLLLLALVFGFSTKLYPECPKTDDVVKMVRQESSPASQEFDSIYKKLEARLKSFVHDLPDGKSLNHYVKEFKDYKKKMQETVHNFHDHTIRHAVHNLLKHFDEFIGILHANQSAGAKVILLRLKLREDLLALIPAEAEWSQDLVCEALAARCKK